MNHGVAFALALLVSAAVHAQSADRFVGKLALPSGQTVVVAEGDFEARSIGSFSVRLYDAAPPEDATTFFVAGLVSARDGSVEKVLLGDVDGDQRPEIIVTVRSVGTGSYLSAHAYTYGKKRLALRAVAQGLPPDADPVQALRKAATRKR